MDGGNISASVDGGEFPFTSSYSYGYYLDTSFEKLYTTGDLFNKSYETGYDADLFLKTGRFYKFFKVSRDYTDSPYTPSSNDASLTGTFGFEMLESDDYKIFNKQEHIIYFLPTGYSVNTTTNYSGINPAGNVFVNSAFTTTPPYNTDKTTFKYIESTTNNAFTPSGNMLVVYNTRSPDSVDIKDYYTGMRTGLKGVNILGIDCHSGDWEGETIDTGRYVKEIREPIHGWIYNSQKPIKYVCLLYGIPTRITGSDLSSVRLFSQNSCSVGHDLGTSMFQFSGYARHPKYVTRVNSEYKQDIMSWNASYIPLTEMNCFSVFTFNTAFESSMTNNTVSDITGFRKFLFEEFSGQSFLCTHITNTTLPGRLKDVSGYISGICNRGKVSGAYLVGSGQNTGFFSYVDYWQQYITLLSPSEHYLNLGINLKKCQIVATGLSNSFTGYRIGGFQSNGAHSEFSGAGSLWENNYTKFSGYNWFITTNYESYAGMMMETATQEQQTFAGVGRLIRPGVMGGVDYSNVPVGFIGTMTEPGPNQIASSQMFNAWFEGRPWIEAAHIGLRHNPSLIFGDPLLICK